jgi:hypothetical protein
VSAAFVFRAGLVGAFVLAASSVHGQKVSLTAQTSLYSTLRPVQNTYRYMDQVGANFFELESVQEGTATGQPGFQLGVAFAVQQKWSAVAQFGWSSYRTQIQTTRVISGILESREDYQTILIPISFGLRWAPIRVFALEAKAGADIFGSGTQVGAEGHFHLAPQHSLFLGVMHARTWEYINTTTADPPNYRLFYSGYTAPFGSLHAQVGYRFAWEVAGKSGVGGDKTRGLQVF